MGWLAAYKDEFRLKFDEDESVLILDTGLKLFLTLEGEEGGELAFFIGSRTDFLEEIVREVEADDVDDTDDVFTGL